MIFFLWRPGLSIFVQVYAFILPQSKSPRFLRRGVHEEILLALCSFPFTVIDLSREWDDLLRATDASLTGYGAVYADAGSETCERLGDLSETRSKYVTLTESHEDGDDNEGDADDWEPLRRKRRMGTPVPLDSRNLRWRAGLSGTWRTGGAHINSLELEALVLAIRQAGRRMASVGRRAVYLIDSKVVVAVVAKGRSSSRVLLRGLRRLAGLLGFLSMTLHAIWIPTEFNPADIFSRIQGIWQGALPHAVGWSPSFWRFLDTFRVVSGSFLELPLGRAYLSEGHTPCGSGYIDGYGSSSCSSVQLPGLGAVGVPSSCAGLEECGGTYRFSFRPDFSVQGGVLEGRRVPRRWLLSRSIVFRVSQRW